MKLSHIKSNVSIFLCVCVLLENKILRPVRVKFESVVSSVKSAALDEVCTSSSQSSQIVCKSHALFCYLATVKLRQKFLQRTSILSEEGFVLNL